MMLAKPRISFIRVKMILMGSFKWQMVSFGVFDKYDSRTLVTRQQRSSIQATPMHRCLLRSALVERHDTLCSVWGNCPSQTISQFDDCWAEI